MHSVFGNNTKAAKWEKIHQTINSIELLWTTKCDIKKNAQKQLKQNNKKMKLDLLKKKC